MPIKAEKPRQEPGISGTVRAELQSPAIIKESTLKRENLVVSYRQPDSSLWKTDDFYVFQTHDLPKPVSELEVDDMSTGRLAE